MAAIAAKLQVFVACALLLLAVGCQASPFWPLEIGYYHDKCPQAEAVVKGVMQKAISQNPGNGAAMIRMLFHDCFVEVRPPPALMLMSLMSYDHRVIDRRVCMRAGLRRVGADHERGQRRGGEQQQAPGPPRPGCG